MREFVGYVGPPEIHDAVIERVDLGPDVLVVGLRTDFGRGPALRIEFDQPSAIDQHRAVGMTLYALAELSSENGRRRFQFVNWEEIDDARLELEATAVRWPTVEG